MVRHAITIICLLLATQAPAQVPRNVMDWLSIAAARDSGGDTDPYLIRHWEFTGALTNASGKVVDSSGNDNTGTPGTGGNLPTWNSQWGGVAYFDGSPDYINFDTGMFVTGSKCTIHVWADTDNAGFHQFWIADVGGTIHNAMYYYSGARSLVEKDNVATTGSPPSPGTGWHLVSVTFDDDTDEVLLYFDASCVATNPSSDGAWTGWVAPRMGNASANAGFDFKGYMDDLRVKDGKADTQTEIQTHYDATKGTYGL